MKASKISLTVYFVFCILSILSKAIENETLLLLTKSCVIPSIYFYYFITSKKVSILFSVAVFSSFVGEAIGLMNFSDELYYIIPPFLVTNSILTFICIKNFDKFKFKTINVLSMVVIIVFLIYLFFAILDLFSNGSSVLILQIIIYGVSLIFLSFFATYNVINRMNFTNLNFVIFTICIVVSATFYVIYYYQYKLEILDNIHFGLQMVSYYFLINFKLNQEKNRNLV